MVKNHWMRLGLPILLAVGMLPMSATASAQNLELIDSRLSRVERVLDQSLLEQLQRVDSLQRELRELRGEIERLNNEATQLRKRNRDLYTDADARLTDLEESVDSGIFFGTDDDTGFGGLDEGTLNEGALDETGEGPSGNAALSALRESNRGASSSGSGGVSAGVFVSERSRSSSSPTATRTNATQAEKAAYTRAYDLLARGQNEAAVQEFETFLGEYPAGPYSFNAWYWKGEAMYAERRFDEAMENFRQVTEQFPTSTKVPDAQLKIGFSLYELGEFAAARPILEQVRDQFQGRSAAVLARKRLQKMDREGV